MISGLTALGAEVVSNPDVTPDELPGSIEDANILVVRSKRVTAEAIAAGRRLSLIVRAGAGVNTIDLDAASRSGTYVANCPGKNTDAVAELAMGLLIACDRGIPDATEALRRGAWEKKKFGNGYGLNGRTLGIVGLGAIGMAVAKRAKAMGMSILAWSRSLTPEKAAALDVEYAETPHELAGKADAVTVHLAVTPETRGVIDARFFESMKERAIFVNTSRGDIVDHAALMGAIEHRGIKAGLDVFANEPSGGSAEFDQIELAAKVACTPHIGASTVQSEEAIAEEALRVVSEFITRGSPPNVVNVRKPRGVGSTLVIRHYNRVGVLARIFELLREAGINIEELQNLIFEHDEAASCSISLDKHPPAPVLARIAEAEEIIEVVTQ